MTRHAFLVLLVVPCVSRADGRVDFNRDVRPILSDACFACHGFDPKARKANLRLDTPEGAFEKREHGSPITPKDLAKSEVWARIISTDAEAVMPPAHANKKLSAAQKETIRKWIEQGAEYRKHWAFEAPVRPAMPKDSGNPIDFFIRERLSKAGLKQQPEADKETLIRRVAFALTGLPPTVKEIDAFLADKSNDAYGKMIDRYLASPHFGEEMARHWLDVARYADTHGLHLDNERQMWAYRDWVVGAFNRNLPFDQFTILQIAGDLLPNPTLDQLVATGYNRCNVTTSEGGSIDKEFTYRYAVERTTAVAQAFLGLTAGCAVCHDHKYDPISAKEFYSLYAFFNNAADPAMDGNINTTAPFIRVPSPALKAATEAAAKREGEAKAKLEQLARTAFYIDPQALKPARRKTRDLLLDDAYPPGVSGRSSSRNAVDWTAEPGFKPASGRRVIRQASAVGYTDTIDFKLRTIVVPKDGVVEFALRVDPHETPKTVSIKLGNKAVAWNKTDAGLVRDGSKDVLKVGEWNRFALPAKDFGLKPGEAISTLVLSQTGGIAYWDALAISGECDPATDPLESYAAWHKPLGKTNPADVPGDILALLKKPELDAFETDKLVSYYLAMIARPVSPELAKARKEWEDARSERISLEESAPGTFVYKETAKPRDSFVMLRGQYDKPGEKVSPAVPAVLPPLPGKVDGLPNRLDLAKWLVAPENPLTARVTVNRLWQQFFGTGLVKTSFDFGSQGDPPSHPELLDWLAIEFRGGGWDVKKFLKMLLMSETFRQQSKALPDVLVKDPENRFYARGPRFRLDAEQVRDNALFVAGLVRLDLGGRGVKPYQPANIWEPVGYADSNTRFYQQDHGDALYRRSLYVFLKRTAPPPFMSNFDAPNREAVCTVRERSNTPMQALQLMNDTQFFEASRALAERAIAEGGKTPAERIEFLYRTVLSRAATREEKDILAKAYAKQLEMYKGDPAAAKKAVHVGESKPRGLAPDDETAAWTMIANLVMNLDETVTRN